MRHLSDPGDTQGQALLLLWCEQFGEILWHHVNFFPLLHVQFDVDCTWRVALGSCSSGVQEIGCVWVLARDYLCLVIPMPNSPVSRTPNLALVINRSSRFPGAPAVLKHMSVAGCSVFLGKALQLLKAPLLEAERKAGLGCQPGGMCI